MTAISTWPGRAESFLDAHGKGAWIAAMVLGFILFWPVGLAILAYMIWGKRMFACKTKNGAGRVRGSSGNAAFDAYKADMLRRLEEEQAAFDDFLRRLREARDKAEFDSFMDERERKRREGSNVQEA